MALDGLGSWGGRGLCFEIEGEGHTRRLALPAAEVVWLGCAAECDVVLTAAAGVEPKHVSVFLRAGRLFVRDHSVLGTRVGGQLVHLALRRVGVPALLELGPYRVRVSLGGARLGLRHRGGWRALRAALLALAGVGLSVALGRGALRSPQPPTAAAECAVDRAVASHAAPDPIEGPVSVVRAVQLLCAGRKLEALAQYRALSARDDSPAPLGVVTGLLEYELSCLR